jgi:hypothetical protein
MVFEMKGMCCNVVGYGSLICPNSLYRTIEEKREMRLVWIKGFKRVFNLVLDGRPMLNVIRSEGHRFNAVVFPAVRQDVTKLNKREWPYAIEETDIYDYQTEKKIGTAMIYVAYEKSRKGVINNSSSVEPDPEYLKFARICAYDNGKDFGRDFDRTTFLNNNLRIEDYVNGPEKLKVKT